MTLNKPNIFSLDADGWCAAARRAPCSNFDDRPADALISLLVIHNISLPPGQFGSKHIEALFANQLDCDAHPYFAQLRGLQVSAHFLLLRDGSAVQFVPTLKRAWHAGASEFNGRARCNDFSIGIELEGSDLEAFTEAQYLALASLTQTLAESHPLSHVAGHQHIAPGRKTDPGPFFDWQRYRSDCALFTGQTVLQTKIITALQFPD
jgi:AmpD protein